MTRARNLVVVMMVAAALTLPVVAQAQTGPAVWSWSNVIEHLSGLTDGIRALVAGSEEQEPSSDPDDGLASDGPQMMTEDDPATGGNVFPLIDPNG